jgi:hypothetical protein
MREMPTRTPRLRLTVRQLINLVVFAALALACLAPLVHDAESNGLWWMVIIVGVVVVPLVWALAAFPLVRKGLFKDRLILALVTVSLGSMFGLLASFAVMHTRFILVQAGRAERFVSIILIVEILGVIGLAAALIFLLRRVVPGVCPECQRRTLFSAHRTTTRQRVESRRLYQCVVCGGQYLRFHKSWRAVRPDSAKSNA